MSNMNTSLSPVEVIGVAHENKLGAPQPVSAVLFSRFLSYLDASPKTVATYSRALRRLFNYFAAKSITHPGREDIVAYREELKETGHKPTTVQLYMTATKLFFKWTAQEGLYENVAEHVKGAKISREHKKDYLTSAQVNNMLDGVERDTLKGLRDYAILTLMVTGALRTIEVVRANVGDMRALGDKTVLYVQGKGRDEKADYVIIDEEVEKAIRAYLKARGKEDEESPLFTSTSRNNAGGRMTTRAVSGIVKERMINAGYNSSRKTAHSLRHTAVTLSLLAGRDLAEVQQFARHTNISTTMIYNHAVERSRNGCSAAVAGAIFRKRSA